MEIQREAYLNQLIERRDNGMIKIVTGIRRCGKSYLLFTIFKRYLLESGVPEDHIIEIALDGIENEELRDPKVCFRGSYWSSRHLLPASTGSDGGTRRSHGKVSLWRSIISITVLYLLCVWFVMPTIRRLRELR